MTWELSLTGLLIGLLVGAERIQQTYGDSVESTTGKVIGAALMLGGLGFLARRFHRRVDVGRQRDVLPRS